MVTTAAVAASDLTVLVDRHGATLHPMGRVVRPHLHSAETASSSRSWWRRPGRARRPIRLSPPARAAPATLAGSTANDRPSGAGTVDVRLLTMTPRLDGLREELPPNRARRAVELVAYLALHQPDVITSDRLRTRVLGSSDADAASKTLFNTAYAAAARHGGRRARRSPLSRRHPQRPLPGLAPR